MSKRRIRNHDGNMHKNCGAVTCPFQPSTHTHTHTSHRVSSAIQKKSHRSHGMTWSGGATAAATTAAEAIDNVRVWRTRTCSLQSQLNV